MLIDQAVAMILEEPIPDLLQGLAGIERRLDETAVFRLQSCDSSRHACGRPGRPGSAGRVPRRDGPVQLKNRGKTGGNEGRRARLGSAPVARIATLVRSR